MWRCTKNLLSSKSRRKRYNCTDQSVLDSPPIIKTFPRVHQEPVTCVSPVASSVCVSGGKDKKVVVFNYENGVVAHEWAHQEKEVTKVLYAPRVPAYFSASRDKSVFMYQDGSPAPVRSFNGHTMVVTGLAVNAANTTMCTGSRDNDVRLWSVETGKCTLVNSISRNLVTHVAWSPTDNFIAQTGEDKEVRIFDSRNLMVVRTFQRKKYIQMWCDVSQDGRYCVTCSNGFSGQGCETTLWDVGSGRIVHEFHGHYETVCCCRFLTPSDVYGGRPIVATSSNDCSVRLWDRDSKVCLDMLSIAGSGPITSISPQPEGTIAVSSFNSGIQVIRIQEITSGITMETIAEF